MKKPLVSLVLFLAISPALFLQFFRPARKEELDSLAALLKTQANDTLQLDRLCRYAYIQQFCGLHEAIATATHAKQLAARLKYAKATWQADVILSQNKFEEKDFSTSIALHEEALRYIDKGKEYDDLLKLRAGFLNVLFFVGDYSKSMNESLEGLDLAREHGDRENIAAYTNLLGFIHFHQQNLPLAKKYYTEYLRLANESGNEMQSANACSNLADVLNEEKNYDEALQYLSRSLGIYKALKNKPHIALAYYNLGHCYKLKGELNKALGYTLDAIDLSLVNLANKYDLAAYYLLLGEIYFGMHQDREAISAFRKGLNISSEIGHRQDIKDACLDLSIAYESLHRTDSAFFYFKRYSGMKDSLLNEKSIQDINNIQTRYDVDKKDREILLLNKQNELAEANVNRNILFRNSIIAIALLLSGIAYLLYHEQQLKQRNRFQEKINRQQNELFNAVITTQEKERKRIAENLHDGIGSLLSTVKLNLERMKEGSLQLNTSQQEHYRNSLAMLNDAVTELRNVSHNIMPAALSKLGLVAALQNLFNRISSAGPLEAELITSNYDSRAEESIEISVYHMVLELLNNTVKHAGATKVTVQLIRFPENMNITVEDNGSGFDMNKESKGIGLHNIASRVKFLGGKMDIDSSPGNGTIIMIEIPFT